MRNGDPDQKARKRHRMAPWFLLGLCVAVVVSAIAYSLVGALGARRTAGGETGPRHVPTVLRPEDFQRTLDREILSKLEMLDDGTLSDWVDLNLLKPLIDDVTTGRLDVTGVQLTAEQFPERPALHKIVMDCAEILHLQKPPRVYVMNDPEFNAYTTNFVDPVIVLNSGLLMAFETDDEVRFVVAHEMGHIACKHVKWMTVVRLLVDILGSDRGPVGTTVSRASVLPLLKWYREAEMSADRAALICVQDLDLCEQALARLSLGLPRRLVGHIDIDVLLAQGLESEISGFAETYVLLRQLVRSHPFPCTRINELRRFHESDTFTLLMM